MAVPVGEMIQDRLDRQTPHLIVKYWHLEEAYFEKAELIRGAFWKTLTKEEQQGVPGVSRLMTVSGRMNEILMCC